MSRGRLGRLHALRGTFGDAAARERSTLLAALARADWHDPGALAAWHDELLFMTAFPANLREWRAAARGRGEILERVRALSAAGRAALADSGIAGTCTTTTFGYGAARWLAARGECIAFEWAAPDDATRLDPLLRLALVPSESDRFESGEISTTAWLDEAAARTVHRARRAPGTAYWLLAHPPAAPEPVLRTLYDEAEPPLRWEIGDSRASTTRAVRPGRPVIRSAFRPAPADPVAHVQRPLAGIRRASPAEARRWHDLACGALLARTREVFPIVHASLGEVHLAPLGLGVMLVLFGTAPSDRSALEANYGYLLAANGVPIGYGGVTTFGAQANTGINIFEAFRRSEAAFVFAQALRAFRTLFGVTRFVVNPFQFGAGNAEAIASGAYWFYDRLGFRPRDSVAAALADRERAAMQRDPTHRSSVRTLRALARGDLVLTLADARGDGPTPESLLVAAGRMAPHALSDVPAGEREAWIDRHARALKRRLTGRTGRLTAAEARGARHLVPVLVALGPQLARWPRADRAAVWSLVARKGATQELAFARAAARLPRLWDLLAARA